MRFTKDDMDALRDRVVSGLEQSERGKESEKFWSQLLAKVEAMPRLISDLMNGSKLQGRKMEEVCRERDALKRRVDVLENGLRNITGGRALADQQFYHCTGEGVHRESGTAMLPHTLCAGCVGDMARSTLAESKGIADRAVALAEALAKRER